MANSAITFNTAGLASATSPGLLQAGGYNVMPAGLIFPYAGNTAPAGFLECDGSEVSKTTYAALYAAIEDTYATQTNPLTGAVYGTPAAGNFRLPDYRGSFLRGVGSPTGKDAVTLGGYQGEKTKTPTSSFTVSTTGNKNQLNTDQVNHSHGVGGNGYFAVGQNNAVALGSGSSAGGLTGTTPQASTLGTAATWNSANFSTSGTVSGGGDNETRPMNKGVKYIIKV